MSEIKAIFLNDYRVYLGRHPETKNMPSVVQRIFPKHLVERIAALTNLQEEEVDLDMLKADKEKYAQVEYVFSTWGMTKLTEEEIREYLPNLKYLFYGAGSVQVFARPYLHQGVRVFSAWGANAEPVAEVTMAEIILANKGFYQQSRLTKQQKRTEAEAMAYPGNYEETVGLIGAGMIGRRVIELLKPFRLHVLVYDPFLSSERAAQLGVEKVDSLVELFSRCQTVSNHLANNPQTVGMLRYEHFSAMKPCGTFINTARGAQVIEEDLIRALTEREDLTAVLDVTDPEPPMPESPFFTLPNVILTPHMAGSNGEEVVRMGEYMVEQFENLMHGRPMMYEVNEAMLETMA